MQREDLHGSQKNHLYVIFGIRWLSSNPPVPALIRLPAPHAPVSDHRTHRPSGNVIGEIGATHIRVPKPPCSVRKQYTNFNGFSPRSSSGPWTSAARSSWFESGAPGSLRDESVLKKTSLYRQIQAEQKKNKTKTTSKNTTKNKAKNKVTPSGEKNAAVPAPGACILGDSAFAERPWLRRPIPNPQTREESYFNHRHGGSRREAGVGDEVPGRARAFGRLKRLFGCLDDLLFSADRGPVVVDACVVLYNFFLAHVGDEERDEEGTYRFADQVPMRKGGNGGRAQWARDCESDPPSARKVEMDYLADEGFLERDSGEEGSRDARMF